MYLKIVTPQGAFFAGDVTMVEFPTSSGELGIFPGHVPLITEVGIGELRIHRGDRIDDYAIAGGFAQIDITSVKIAAAFASGESEEASIEEACERAQRALESADMLPPEIATTALERLKAQVARLLERKRSALPH